MSTCRIGVTGHRTFDNLLGTQRQVDNVIATLASDGGMVEVWTSPAEGADRVVTERVLAARPSAQVHVVLPLDVDDYCSDFATTESVDAFRRLLNRAASVKVMQHPALTSAVTATAIDLDIGAPRPQAVEFSSRR